MSLEVTGAPLHFGIVVDTETFDVSGVANSLNALLLDFQKLGDGGDVVIKDLIKQFDELNKTQLGLRDKIALELDPATKSALQADLQGVLQKMSDINAEGRNFKGNFSGALGKEFITANNSVEVFKRNLEIALDPKVQAGALARKIEKGLAPDVAKQEIQREVDDQIARLNIAREKLAAATKKALETPPTELPKPKPIDDKELEGVDKAVAAYTRLRQVKNELAAERVIIPPGGFKSAEEEAIAYQNALRNTNKELLLAGKNTAGISALKEGVRGLVGAFEAVSGAIALFGGDSKEAEEATKAVIGAMGILNGVEEITALLSKNSAVNFYLESVAKKADEAATDADAAALARRNAAAAAGVELTDATVASAELSIGAKETEAVVTNEATVAQIGLNTAMELNPVGILLVALVGLFAAYETYINTLGKVTDAEKAAKASREALKEIEDKAAAGIAAESDELNRLVAASKSDLLTRKQKQDAINDAIAKNPEYLSGLNLENVATKEGSELIQKQIDLIRARALVKASTGVIDKAVEAQIKAQNELNDVMEHGSTIGQRLQSVFLSNTGRRVGESNEAAVIREKEEALANATINVNAKVAEQNKLVEDLGKQFQTDSEKISLYIEQLDRIIDRSFGVEKVLAQQQKILATPFKFQQVEVKPFVEKDFEAEKKDALNQQQALVDIAKNGTKQQISAKRSLLLEEQQQNLKDARLFNQATGEIMAGQTGEVLARRAKILKGLHELDLEEQAIDNKSAIANAEALAIHLQAIGQESTKQYHEARLQAIKDAARVALAQEGLTAGEAARIRKQMELDLANERIRFQKSITEAEISAIQARLNLVKAGSAEELNLRLEIIEKQKEKELEALGLTKERRAEIDSDAAKKRADILNSYFLQQIKNESAGQSAVMQTRLAEVRKGSDEELALQREMIRQKSDQAQIDIINSTDAEELKVKKIAQIQAQARADEQKLDDEATAKRIDSELSIIDQTTRRRKNKDDLIISDPFSSDIAKFEAARDKIDADISATAARIDELTSKALASHGDTTALKKQIEELKIELELLRAQAAQSDASIQIKKLERTATAIGNISAAANVLASSLKGVDSVLSEILSTLAGVTGAAQNAVNSIKKITEGQAKNKEKSGTGFQDILTGAAGLAGSFFSVVGIINGIIGKANEARRQQRIEQDKDQVNLIQGEIAINDKYRERLLLQAQINKLKFDAIKAEAEALAKNKASTEKDFADILARVQALKAYDPNASGVKHLPDGSLILANGTIIPASQVATFGSLAGKSFDDLEKLFLTGQLEGKAKDLFQTLEKLKQEGVDIDAALAANEQKRKEAFAGTTAQDIVDTIKDGFSQGFKSVQDFAGKTEDIIRKAMLNALEAKALAGPIQKIFDQFAADAESGGGLDQTEIANFTKNINKTIADAEILAEQIQKATGVNLAAATGQTNSLTGSIKKELTEQTGTVIAGGINGIRLTNIEQLNVANKTFDQINKIQINTLSAANGIQEMLKFYRLWTSGDRVKVA